jgi:hypothetical protein
MPPVPSPPKAGKHRAMVRGIEHQAIFFRDGLEKVPDIYCTRRGRAAWAEAAAPGETGQSIIGTLRPLFHPFLLTPDSG